MEKSKIIDSFFKRKACDEDEKNTYTSFKIVKLHENSKIEENEKQLYKVPKLYACLYLFMCRIFLSLFLVVYFGAAE